MKPSIKTQGSGLEGTTDYAMCKSLPIAACTIFLFGGEDVAKYQNWLEPEALLLIEAWARDGLTDEQIASNMGIATSTLYNWKNEHLEILEALKKGKEVVDIQVENALLKRALGYTYKETTSECDEDGELKVTKVVTKEVVPDTTAQIFWLKNRRPDLWRDKQNIEHSGQINNPFSDLTTEELRKLADAE